MNLFVDSIDANQCRNLSNHPSKTLKDKKYPKDNSCRVDLVLRSIKDNSQTYLELKRIAPKKDIFEGAGGKHANPADLKELEGRGWKIPHDGIKKAIYIQNRFFEDESHLQILSNELFDELRSDMVTFVAFGVTDQADPKKFNANLNTRLVERVHQARYQFPDKWFPVRDFLKTLQKDPNLSLDERGRIQWLNDVGSGANLLGNAFSYLIEKFPEMEKAYREILLFQYSPEFRVSDFPKSITFQKAAKSYGEKSKKGEDGKPSPDFFWYLNKAVKYLSDHESLKTNLVLLGRNHQLEKLTQQALDENWGYLLSQPSPKDALQEGLKVQYAQTDTQKEIMDLFVKNVTVVFEGEEQKPHFFIALDSFNKDVMTYIEDPELDPKKRKEGISFINEVVLGQLLAQGQNMRIFWDGHFQERVNFYPNLEATRNLPQLLELKKWTQRKINIMEPKVQDKTEMNLWGFSFGVASVGVGLLGSLIAYKAKPIRTPFMIMLGGGLGSVSGNFICQGLDISNSWGYCDIIGAILGGTLSGYLSHEVLGGNDFLLPIPEVPSTPGPDHRFPTDIFGP